MCHICVSGGFSPLMNIGMPLLVRGVTAPACQKKTPLLEQSNNANTMGKKVHMPRLHILGHRQQPTKVPCDGCARSKP